MPTTTSGTRGRNAWRATKSVAKVTEVGGGDQAGRRSAPWKSLDFGGGSGSGCLRGAAGLPRAAGRFCYSELPKPALGRWQRASPNGRGPSRGAGPDDGGGARLKGAGQAYGHGGSTQPTGNSGWALATGPVAGTTVGDGSG